MSEVSQWLQHYRRQRAWTRAVVEAVPEEHFDWAPADSSFGCGDLVRHLIQAETFWRRLLAAAIEGESYDPFGLGGSATRRMRDFRAPNLAASRDPRCGSSFAECLVTWESVSAKTEELLGGLSAEALSAVRVRHPLTGLEGTLREFLMVMFEHEAYHRGQLTAYMKMLGVELPTSQWT